MGIGEFLLWIESARVDERVEAARLIARTTLRADISIEERCTAEAALALLLDDPSPLVRGALSEVLSLSAQAPKQVLHALALDQFDVSAAVLVRSALGDETLLEILKRGNSQAAMVIADRANLPEKVAMAVAERCGLEPCLILITNQTAKVGTAVLDKIIDRHSTSAEMRGALLADTRLDLNLRQRLIDASSHALCSSNFVQSLIGASRAADLEAETISDSALDVVEYAELESLPPYVRNLRNQGRLTSALALKALVYGRIDFVATILSDLAGRSEDHVRSVLVRGGENAIRALLKEIGFSGVMLQLALRALLTWRQVASGQLSLGRQELAWQLMREAEDLERNQGHNSENDDLAAYMRKIYLEITRANARAHANDLVIQAKKEEAIAIAAVATLERDIAELMLADEMQMDEFFLSKVDGSIDPAVSSFDQAFTSIQASHTLEASLLDNRFLAEFAEEKPESYRSAA